MAFSHTLNIYRDGFKPFFWILYSIRMAKITKTLMNRQPKYLWYYGAAILLVYFVWNYYTAGPLNHFGTSSLENVEYEKAKTLPFSSVTTNWLGDNEVSSEGANVTKAVTSSVSESVEMLSDRLGVPNYHSDSFESSMVNSMSGTSNLMSTPNYQLSKSHILLERQLPPSDIRS